jgi:hypothetical protein
MRGVIATLGRALAWTAGAALWIAAVMLGAVLLFLGAHDGTLPQGVLGGCLLVAAAAAALVLNDRAKARRDARLDQAESEVEAHIEAAAARGFPAAGVVFRTGLRAIVALLAIAAGGAAILAVARAPENAAVLVFAVLGAAVMSPLIVIIMLRSLPGFPVLVIGPEGIDDVAGAGLIPWNEVAGASLTLSLHTRQSRVPMPVLKLRLREADRHRARISRLLNWFAKFDHDRDTLRIPLFISAVRAGDAVAALRYFHSPQVPTHHLVAYGTGYRVDPRLGEAQAELERAKVLLDATVAEEAALRARGIVDENAPEYRAWLARSEARHAELKNPARSDAALLGAGEPRRAADAQLRCSPAWRVAARAIVLLALVGFLLALAAAAVPGYQKVFGSGIAPPAQRLKE